MAKGKSAVALFDVLSKDRRFTRKNQEIPQSPLEIAPRASAIAQKPPVQNSASLAARAVDLWRKRHTDPEKWTFSPVKIRQSVSERFSTFKSGFQGGYTRSAKFAQAAQGWIVRQNSIVCGAAAAVVMIAGLMLARHGHHSAPQAASVEEVLRDGPPHPAVLAVADVGHVSQAQPSTVSQTLSPEMQMDVQQAAEKTGPDAASSVLAKPGARIVNMQYVLMQSYFEEKTAIEARDFLTNHGIPCTIERGVRGWRPDFYQVIGLQGFARPSGVEYFDYLHRIEDLGPKFSKSHYKRFVPQAIKW